jgi:hypothetical protein
LVVSAALLGRKNCGGRGQIVFQIFTTIIKIRALSIIHESTGRSLVREFYPTIFLCYGSALLIHFFICLKG